MRHSHSPNRPIDGPLDETNNTREQTGLLTRFTPRGLKTSSLYRWFLRLVRLLQFLSAVIALGIFSARLHRVHRLVNSTKPTRGVNSSYGAVEGILAAATLYTLINLLLDLIKRSANPGSRGARWLWVLFDIIFVGAFIAVAVLTRPNGGDAGPRHCYNGRSILGGNRDARDGSCHLSTAAFSLAILSTILHAITAAWHEFRTHRRERNARHEKPAHPQRSSVETPTDGRV